jgi:hypothetical protein
LIKAENKYLISKSLPGYVPNRDACPWAPKDILKNIHGGIICNNPKLEIIQVPPIVRWVIMLYSYTGKQYTKMKRKKL